MSISGRPANTVLQSSKCDTTRPIISVFTLSSVRYLRISFILWILIMLARHFLYMCSFIFRFSSNHTPRYLTMALLSTVEPLTLMDLVVHFLSCCHPPNIMNSVFQSFMQSRFSSIQVLTSPRHNSRM